MFFFKSFFFVSNFSHIAAEADNKEFVSSSVRFSFLRNKCDCLVQKEIEQVVETPPTSAPLPANGLR